MALTPPPKLLAPPAPEGKKKKRERRGSTSMMSEKVETQNSKLPPTTTKHVKATEHLGTARSLPEVQFVEPSSDPKRKSLFGLSLAKLSPNPYNRTPPHSSKDRPESGLGSKTSFNLPGISSLFHSSDSSSPSTSSFSCSTLTTFGFRASDVDEILDYLLEVFECHQVEIDKFLAAFSNFDIDLHQLFEAFVAKFKKLVENCEGSKEVEEMEPEDKTQNIKALMYILRVWLAQSGAVYEKQFPKFFQSVVRFVSSNSSKDQQMNSLKLLLLKNKHDNEQDSSHSFIQSITQQLLSPIRPTPNESLLKPRLFQYPVKDIADAITFVMFRVYVHIGPSELHDGSWQGEARPVRAPHVNLLSILFNHISFLCGLEILYANDLENQVFAFQKVVDIAKTLFKMNNFEGTTAVMSILGSAAIKRLKPVWSAADSKSLKRAKKLEEVIQPTKNYKTYNHYLQSASPPILPWLAPKLRLLRFLYDGNKKTLEDGTIDYEYLQTAGSSINEYLQHQQQQYKLNPPIELIQTLEDVTLLNEEEVEDKLYEQSIQIFSLK